MICSRRDHLDSCNDCQRVCPSLHRSQDAVSARRQLQHGTGRSPLDPIVSAINRLCFQQRTSITAKQIAAAGEIVSIEGRDGITDTISVRITQCNLQAFLTNQPARFHGFKDRLAINKHSISGKVLNWLSNPGNISEQRSPFSIKEVCSARTQHVTKIDKGLFKDWLGVALEQWQQHAFQLSLLILRVLRHVRNIADIILQSVGIAIQRDGFRPELWRSVVVVKEIAALIQSHSYKLRVGIECFCFRNNLVRDASHHAS